MGQLINLFLTILLWASLQGTAQAKDFYKKVDVPSGKAADIAGEIAFAEFGKAKCRFKNLVRYRFIHRPHAGTVVDYCAREKAQVQDDVTLNHCIGKTVAHMRLRYIARNAAGEPLQGTENFSVALFFDDGTSSVKHFKAVVSPRAKDPNLSDLTDLSECEGADFRKPLKPGTGPTHTVRP